MLSHFYNDTDLYSHVEILKPHEPAKQIMHKAGETTYFKRYHNKIEQPYAIYMDFESALYMIHTSKFNTMTKFTIKTDLHKPYMFSIYPVS